MTVSALIAMYRPEQLRSHLARARENGVTRGHGVPWHFRQIRPLRDAVELSRFARNLEIQSADETKQALSVRAVDCTIAHSCRSDDDAGLDSR